MKQGDLEGCKGIIEEVVEGKAKALLVGGRARYGGTDVEVEPVEVLPPDFAEVGLYAQLGIRPGAMKEDAKAAYKKMVLTPNQTKTKATRRRQQSCSNGGT